jgi:toxin ParE1/3/4
MRLRRSPDADSDIDDIYLHGAKQFGVPEADRYIDGVADAFEMIAQFPMMAMERDEIQPPVRVYRYRSHLIVYRIMNDEVYVTRILHYSMDWVGEL